ncbi:unnamed protein product [Parajaminaea phylloscopi]
MARQIDSGSRKNQDTENIQDSETSCCSTFDSTRSSQGASSACYQSFRTGSAGDGNAERARTARKSQRSAPSSLPFGRAFSLLCLASVFAGQSVLSPVRQAAALALPASRQPGKDTAKANISASAARKIFRASDKFRQHYVGVGPLPNEVDGATASLSAAPEASNAVVEVVTVDAHNIAHQSAASLAQAASLAANTTGRWGQTASYLSGGRTVLFVGGQVSNGSHVSLTNDVFALNVSSIETNSTSGPTEPWKQLPSNGLAPHAFASHIMLGKDENERLWIVGGNTDNCSDVSAWTWSPNGSNDLNSSWTAVNSGEDGRRSGAVAIEVPSQAASVNASSYLLLGGRDALADCRHSAIKQQKRDTAASLSADLWTFATGSSSGEGSARDSAVPSVVGIALDTRNGDFSLQDYSTVTLPGESSVAGDTTSTMFLGGLTASSQYASLDTLWVFYPWVGTWSQVPTQGQAPTGRRGHTATLLKNKTVVIMGGLLEDGSLSNEVYTLDLTQYPAQWAKAPLASDGVIGSPAKAYHSTVLVDDVLIMAFGAGEASETLSGSSSAPPSLYYLDTAAPGGWRWSDSIQGVLSGRGVTTAASSPQQQTAVSHDSPAASSESSSAENSEEGDGHTQSQSNTANGNDVGGQKTPQDGESDPSSPLQISSSTADSPDDSNTGGSEHHADTHADGSQLAGSIQSPSGTNTNSDSGHKSDGNSSSSGSHTGAIAGSLVGAAALAAVCGGLYAYKKRKEGHEEGARQSDMMARNVGGSRPSLPPVSALWFNNVKRRGDSDFEGSLTQSSDLIGNARRMPGRKSLGPRETGWTPSFMQGMNDVAPPQSLTSAARPETLYEDPYLALDHTPVLDHVQSHLGPPTSGYPRFAKSSDSLGNDFSDGEASHFSYPYLSGMHRPSVGEDGTYATPASFEPHGTPLSSSFVPSGRFGTPQMATFATPVEMADQRRSSVPIATAISARGDGNRLASAGYLTNQALSNTWQPELAERRNAVLAQELVSPFDDIHAGVSCEDLESEELCTDAAVHGSSHDAGLSENHLSTSTSCSADLSSLLGQRPQGRAQHESRRVFSDGAATIRSTAREGNVTPVEAYAPRLQTSRRAKRSQLRVMNPSSGVESDA